MLKTFVSLLSRHASYITLGHYVTLPGTVKRLQPIIISFLYRKWRWSATGI